jgi:hypothetical protein
MKVHEDKRMVMGDYWKTERSVKIRVSNMASERHQVLNNKTSNTHKLLTTQK